MHTSLEDALDIRAVAMLIIAASKVKGITKIFGVEHILRGYEGFIDSLTQFGISFKKINLPEKEYQVIG